jgi:hypothetical protein
MHQTIQFISSQKDHLVTKLLILQNNANDESFANTLNIRILQHNYARSTQIMHACMKFAKNSADIVILQES